MSSNSRKPHILRPEKTLAIPRHVIFFDVESELLKQDDGKTIHKLKLGWACYYRWGSGSRADKETWFNFTKDYEFWDFVMQYAHKKNRLWLIAHKLPYDFTVLDGFKALTEWGFKVNFFYSKGNTTLIKVKGKHLSLVFVDSLNWFKEKLADIGNRIGVPKMEIDFEKCSTSFLNTYCRNDVLILLLMFKQLVTFLRSHSISRLCYTLGSTAMAAYLFSHYDHKIYIHNNQEAIDLERESYKGGRTECFYLGKRSDGPFYVVDVNSLYPFVMKKNLYPVKYVKYYPDITRSEFNRVLKSYSVIAQVLIQTTEAVCPIREERTIFPIGRFWATLTTPEIQYIKTHHKILAVGRCVIYDKANLFSSYVDRFYKLRKRLQKEGNPIYEHFTKLLLNSLYGKFGQKADIWQKIGEAPGEPDRIENCFDVELNRRRKLRYLLGEVFENTGSDESRHSFPGIAAHVTAYARLYLYKLMKTAGHENYFYCDTDSLFVNQTGLDNLSDFMHKDNLGGLKLERESKSIMIYGLKDYELDDKTVLKGISPKADKLTPTRYRQEQWPTLGGLLFKGQTGQYYTVSVEKELNRLYTKALVHHDGSLSPFVLSDDVSNFPPPKKGGPLNPSSLPLLP